MKIFSYLLWAGRIGALFIMVFAQIGGAHSAPEPSQADALRAKYDSLKEKLAANQFHKPLYLDSNEKSEGVVGDMYAIINHPFTTVSTTLNLPENWCDILILHFNVKHCRALSADNTTILNVSIGKKHNQPLEKAYPVAFDYRVTEKTYNYLQVRLKADRGPISTRNYSIIFEAIPLKNGHTFVHLAYSYSYGFVGNLALRTYLNTVGGDKVGFTIVDKRSDGGIIYIDGVRGIVERNTMRYYLAIEAFLNALSMPPAAQLEKRLLDWFSATERYPRQLHEMDKNTYLSMKYKEYARQQKTVHAIQPPFP